MTWIITFNLSTFLIYILSVLLFFGVGYLYIRNEEAKKKP